VSLDIGMLWSLGPRQSLTDQVREAAEFYLCKYGLQATECWLHPTVLAASGLDNVGAIHLHGSRTVARGELWIGVGQSVSVGQ